MKYNEDSVCCICDHNDNDRRCFLGRSDFMSSSLRSEDDCPDCYIADPDDDDDDDDDDAPECIECGSCGGDAYLDGDCYVCDNCGWTCECE